VRLRPGTEVPVLSTIDFLGEPVDLAALRGRPVMLSFYRYASCPVCNLRMHQLIAAHDHLDELGIALVAVFQSSPAQITEHVGRQDAPFPIVADPSMELYRRFGVEARWRGLFTWAVIKTALRAFRHGYLPGRIDGPVQRTPADFLIDADGTIAVAHYGRDINDHIPLVDIETWLQSASRPVVPE